MSIKPDIGYTWYIQFSTEERDAQNALPCPGKDVQGTARGSADKVGDDSEELVSRNGKE